MEAQRAKRLGDRLALKSHAERVTEAMRKRVYASSWPIVNTTATPATSTPSDKADAEVEEEVAPGGGEGEAAVPIGPPQAAAPQVGEPSEDGRNEGEILGAVGVSEDGEVKLYILETLPEVALEQVCSHLLSLLCYAHALCHQNVAQKANDAQFGRTV